MQDFVGNSMVYVVKFFLLGNKVIRDNIMAGSVTKIAQFVEFCTSQMLNIAWIICSRFLIISSNHGHAHKIYF